MGTEGEEPPGPEDAARDADLRPRADAARRGPRPPVEGGALVVARRLTGKPGGDDHTDKRLALFRRAARETHPDRPLRLEIHYLVDGKPPADRAARNALQAQAGSGPGRQVRGAARGIALGLFPANEGDECKTCGYGLICPL